MITENSISAIRDAVRIDEVVQDYVKLTKAGVNLKAPCPFHNEKTASFNVNPARNGFKCFGCGAGGDSITFVMKHLNKSYPEALRILAGKYKIEIEEDTSKTEPDNTKLTARATAAIMQAHFAEHNEDEETPAIRYWRERGFTNETLDDFGVGYCDGTKPEAEGLYTLLGLINDEGNLRFYKRTTIPIHDRVGNVIAWGARALAEKKDQAKYMNSPESILYTKSKVLFNLHRAVNHIRAAGEIWIVEGYADAMAMHQMGIRNVVALCGTALSPEQVAEIRRFNGDRHLRIILAFDNEIAEGKAGYKVNVANAFNHALNALIEIGEVRTVIYPKHVKDMADLMRSGATPQALEQRDAIKYMIEARCTNDWQETASPVEKAEFYEKIAKLVSKVKKDNVRNIYITSVCSDLMLNAKEFAAMVKGFITESETGEINQKAAEYRWIKVGDEYYERLIEHDIFTKSNSVIYRRRKRQEMVTEGVAITKIPRFHDWICQPSHTDYQRIITINHETDEFQFFNSYQPMPHSPKEFALPDEFIRNPETFDYENIPEIRHTAAFMKHIFGWDEHRNKYLTLGWDWITLCYLKPTQRLQALCLVSSEEGTGKSTFINLILAIFGQNATKTEASRIGGNFNALSGGKVIQCVEETKDEKGSIENKLKDLITAYEKVVEAKHQDARVVKSFDKYIFASNHEDGFMKVGTETTRFAVMKVKAIKDKVPDFEEKLYLEIPYLLYFMMKRGVITPKTDRLWFSPKLWENEALLKLRHASKDQVQQVMEELMQSIWIRCRIAEPILYVSSQYLKLLMCAYGGKSYEQKTPVYFLNTSTKDMRLNYWDNPITRTVYELKNIHTDAFINASEWDYEVKRTKSRFIEFPIYKFVRPEVAFDSFTAIQCEELINGVSLINEPEAKEWVNSLQYYMSHEHAR